MFKLELDSLKEYSGKQLNYDIDISTLNQLGLNDFSRMWFHYDETYPEHRLIEDIETRWDNQFNKKFEYKKENGFHTLKYVPVEHVLTKYNDIEVEYKFNNDWFRSDHFTKEHDGTHILFMGCSNTEGLGADYDKTWAYMLHKEISENVKTSGYFNLSKSGYGHQQLINNFLVYIKKYGVPEYLFVLHPNITRRFDWYESKNQWQFNQHIPWHTNKFHNVDDDQRKRIYLAHRVTFPDWAIQWNLFINFLKLLNVKFIWSTWDSAEITNITNIKIFEDSFLPISPQPDKDLIEKFRPDLKTQYGDLEVRDGHPGFLQQLVWKDAFKQEITNRGWLKND